MRMRISFLPTGVVVLAEGEREGGTSVRGVERERRRGGGGEEGGGGGKKVSAFGILETRRSCANFAVTQRRLGHGHFCCRLVQRPTTSAWNHFGRPETWRSRTNDLRNNCHPYPPLPTGYMTASPAHSSARFQMHSRIPRTVLAAPVESWRRERNAAREAASDSSTAGKARWCG